MLLLDTEVAEVVAGMQHGLNDRKNLGLAIQAIKAGVAVLLTDDRAEQMSEMMPSILDVSAHLAALALLICLWQVFPFLAAQNQQALLARALYAFMEIYNSQHVIGLLSPFLRPFLGFTLSLLGPGSSIDVQKAVLEIIASTAEMAPSLMQESYHVEISECTKTLLDCMQRIPGQAMDGTFWDADVDDQSAEDEQINIVAEDTLDRLLQACGPDHVLPIAFETIPGMLAADDWKKRYAGLSAIGTLAEGSTNEFRKDLQAVIGCVSSLWALRLQLTL